MNVNAINPFQSLHKTSKKITCIYKDPEKVFFGFISKILNHLEGQCWHVQRQNNLVLNCWDMAVNVLGEAKTSPVGSHPLNKRWVPLFHLHHNSENNKPSLKQRAVCWETTKNIFFPSSLIFCVLGVTVSLLCWLSRAACCARRWRIGRPSCQSASPWAGELASGN